LNSGMKIDPQISFGKTVVALEPGAEWFKLVKVTRGRDGVKVDRVILRRTEEVEPLAGPGFLKALGLQDLQGDPVIVCLPRQMVNVRLFDLPSGDQQEIADMVDLQIARQTPYSRDEIVFDYRLFRSDKEGYTRVMLVIVQTGVVRQKYRFLEESGLSVGLVTVTTDGWLAALQSGELTLPQSGSGAVAFLDCDSTSGDLVILNNGVPLFSRSMTIGSTQVVAGGGQLEKCVQEISRAFETFRNETPGVAVSLLVLSGGAAKLPALAAGLKSALGLDVTALVGMEKLTDDLLLPPESKGVSLAGVLGAAANAKGLQLNLIPESVRMRKGVIAKALQLTLTGILLLAIFGMLSLFILSRTSRQEAYLAELTRMIKATAKTADETDGMRRKVAIVAERLGTKMIPAKVLVELYGVIGEGTAFTAIEISDGAKLVCRGNTETVADTVRLVNAMESSSLFQNVKSTRTVSGKDRTEFEITCELEKKRP
jgi:Tfp pilus assembly PilM family ATPase